MSKNASPNDYLLQYISAPVWILCYSCPVNKHNYAKKYILKFLVSFSLIVRNPGFDSGLCSW